MGQTRLADTIGWFERASLSRRLHPIHHDVLGGVSRMHGI